MKRRIVEEDQRQQLQLAITMKFSSLRLFLLLAMLVSLDQCHSATTPLNQAEDAAVLAVKQAAQVVSKLIKPQQVAVCDGDSLRIACDEDYIIEVIEARYTIFSAEDSKVSNTTSHQVHSTLPPAIALDSNRQICPTNKQLQHHQVSGSSSSSTSGNGIALATNQTTNATVCDSAQASAAQSAVSATFSARQECQSLNSCLIDLRWLQPQISAVAGQSLPANETDQQLSRQQPQLHSQPQHKSPPNPNGRLARLVNEACPGNRKLLELDFRCRPSKLSKRQLCRGAKLAIECPVDKLIVVASGEFGSWPTDTRARERCYSELASTRNETSSAMQLPPLQPLSKACSAGGAQLPSLCTFKSQCTLDVLPSLFGDTHCPAGQPEYLKVMWSCVSESILIRRANSSANTHTSTTNRPDYTRVQPGGSSRQQSDSPQPTTSSFTSSNISTSSLLRSTPEKGTQSLVSSLSAVSGRSSEAANSANAGPHLVAVNRLQDSEFQQLPGTEPSNFDSEIVRAVESQPELASRNPKQWTVAQTIKFLYARYQSQTLVICLASVSIVVAALLISGCRNGLTRARRSSSNSSRDSKDSSASCSTKSSHAFKSFGGGGGSSSCSSNSGAPGSGPNQSNVANLNATASHLKHNSCSESCFSLEDYQLGRSSAANSPALIHSGNNNNYNFGGEQALESEGVVQGLARPKLWTIYGVGQSGADPNRISGTMRPTRTFVSQPVVPRPLQCLHSAGTNNNDLLLAMASNSQQQQQANWCSATTLSHPNQSQNQNQNPNLNQHQHHHHLQQQQPQQPMQQLQQQPSPIGRLTLLMGAQLAQADLNNHHHHHHLVDLQANDPNQQQQLLFPPPAIQLELPQVQQQQQQQQPFNQQATLQRQMQHLTFAPPPAQP